MKSECKYRCSIHKNFIISYAQMYGPFIWFSFEFRFQLRVMNQFQNEIIASNPSLVVKYHSFIATIQLITNALTHAYIRFGDDWSESEQFLNMTFDSSL